MPHLEDKKVPILNPELVAALSPQKTPAQQYLHTVLLTEGTGREQVGSWLEKAILKAGREFKDILWALKEELKEIRVSTMDLAKADLSLPDHLAFSSEDLRRSPRPLQHQL